LRRPAQSSPPDMKTYAKSIALAALTLATDAKLKL
jgi:hypothetical protein